MCLLNGICMLYNSDVIYGLTNNRCPTVERRFFQLNNGSGDMRFSVFPDSSCGTLHYEQCSSISRVSMSLFRLLKTFCP